MLKSKNFTFRWLLFNVLIASLMAGCSHNCVRPGDFRFSIEKVVDTAEHQTRTSGGATLRLNGEDLSGKRLYAVAIYPEEEQRISGLPSKKDLSRYLHEHREMLRDPKNSFGAWYDRESQETYLDVSTVRSNEEEAAQLADRYNQKAIYDLFQRQEIRAERFAD